MVDQQSTLHTFHQTIALHTFCQKNCTAHFSTNDCTAHFSTNDCTAHFSTNNCTAHFSTKQLHCTLFNKRIALHTFCQMKMNFKPFCRALSHDVDLDLRGRHNNSPRCSTWGKVKRLTTICKGKERGLSAAG